MATGMTKLGALTLAATTLLTAGLAHADDVVMAPGNTPPVSSDVGPKSPDTALMLSLGGTAASAALVLAGGASNDGGLVAAGLLSSLVTPSLGEWYAGKPLTLGMGVRVASAAAEMYGLAEAFSCWDSCSSGDNNTAGVLIIGGLVGYAAGTIYDIADAPSSAREYNRAHAWHITPAMMRTPSGNTQLGVGIGGSF